MSDDLPPEKKPTLWQMVASVLAAFAGVQSDGNLNRDDSYIDKHGFMPFVIIGILLTLVFVGLVFMVVQAVLHLAS